MCVSVCLYQRGCVCAYVCVCVLYLVRFHCPPSPLSRLVHRYRSHHTPVPFYLFLSNRVGSIWGLRPCACLHACALGLSLPRRADSLIASSFLVCRRVSRRDGIKLGDQQVRRFFFSRETPPDGVRWWCTTVACGLRASAVVSGRALAASHRDAILWGPADLWQLLHIHALSLPSFVCLSLPPPRAVDDVGNDVSRPLHADVACKTSGHASAGQVCQNSRKIAAEHGVGQTDCHSACRVQAALLYLSFVPES